MATVWYFKLHPRRGRADVSASKVSPSTASLNPQHRPHWMGQNQVRGEQKARWEALCSTEATGTSQRKGLGGALFYSGTRSVPARAKQLGRQSKAKAILN